MMLSASCVWARFSEISRYSHDGSIVSHSSCPGFVSACWVSFSAILLYSNVFNNLFMIFPFAFKNCYFLEGFRCNNKEIIPENRGYSNKFVGCITAIKGVC